MSAWMEYEGISLMIYCAMLLSIAGYTTSQTREYRNSLPHCYWCCAYTGYGIPWTWTRCTAWIGQQCQVLWFLTYPRVYRTGDTAGTEGDDNCWKILGRTSTDIIKSGGYKISALQIEDALLAHSKISNCAVLGIEDEALGEAIAAVISCDSDKVDCQWTAKQ